jgi:hypothetical protein
MKGSVAMKKPMVLIALAAAVMFLGSGCRSRYQVETVHKIEVAPMHITIDVNVRVDKALDDFFGDLDKVEEKLN